VTGLVGAINTANGNGVPDTVCLAAGSTYTLTSADTVQSDGANGPAGHHQ